MAIQAIVSEIIKDPDATVVRVLYTDGQSFKDQKEYRFKSFDLAEFKNTVRNQIAEFSKGTTKVGDVLQVGPLDVTVAPPPPPPDPTPEELAREKFRNDLFTLRQMEKAITLKLMSVNDNEYTDQVALVESEFLPAYLSLL